MQVFCIFSLPNVLFAIAACLFSTSKYQKMVRVHQFFNILTSKYASRHSGVQFFDKNSSNMQCFNILTCKYTCRHSGVEVFDIAPSKNSLQMQCFCIFSLKNVFSLQRYGIFRCRNFKKWSENGVFCTF